MAKFPPYVKLHTTNISSTTMRLAQTVEHRGYYYRDNGDWFLKAEFEKDKLVVSAGRDPIKHLTGKELSSITKEEWAEENNGSFKALTRGEMLHSLAQCIQYGYLNERDV